MILYNDYEIPDVMRATSVFIRNISHRIESGDGHSWEIVCNCRHKEYPDLFERVVIATVHTNIVDAQRLQRYYSRKLLGYKPVKEVLG